MSVLFQSICNSSKVYFYCKPLRASLASCKCIGTRNYTVKPKKFVSFDDIASQRRAEAKRSIVVQVNSEHSFRELYGYCSHYGDIHGVHHYRNGTGEHFMLIEFTSEDCLKDVLQNCSAHHSDSSVMTSQSPFLWFRAISNKKEKCTIPASISLATLDGNAQIPENNLFETLEKCANVSEQIQLLYTLTRLNDLGVRLRYMVARQLEMLLGSLYANIVVRPFGSSVNGFGKIGCDLDLVLTNEVPPEMCSSNKRLVYHQKEAGSTWSHQLALAAELLQQGAAGTARVQRILHARVPIVKFAHELAALDCDLCCGNMSGVYMSELLFSLGALGAARALGVAVRRWARGAGVTSRTPGRWLTNFPLTLMVLFFLQRKRALPTLKELVERAGKEDIRIAEDNVNCTFLRDMNKLPPELYGQNTDSLETLLLQFFEFYAQFNFADKAISIIEGAPIRKPNNQPLYIVNPLDPSMNVSRNVSFEECQRLQAEVRNAAWQLETSSEGHKKDDWGILGILEKKSNKHLRRLLQVGNSHRLVSVKDLFTDDDDGDKETSKQSQKNVKSVEKSVREMKEEINSKQNTKDKNEQLKFKNRQIASEVYRIRRDKMV